MHRVAETLITSSLVGYNPNIVYLLTSALLPTRRYGNQWYMGACAGFRELTVQLSGILQTGC